GQLRDRLSLRRFVGLTLEDQTPDETTFVRLRQRLREANLDATLFDQTLAHLEAQGLIVKAGTLVDATILEAPRGRAKKDAAGRKIGHRSEEHTSELQSRENLVCRLLLEKKKKYTISTRNGK